MNDATSLFNDRSDDEYPIERLKKYRKSRETQEM